MTGPRSASRNCRRTVSVMSAADRCDDHAATIRLQARRIVWSRLRRSGMPVLQVQRNLSRHLQESPSEATAASHCLIRSKRLLAHDGRIEHIEDAILLEEGQQRTRRVNGKRLPFAKWQQPGQSIDIATA